MTNHTVDSVTIYTDGACSGNPGPGGWGVLIRWRGREKKLNGGEAETTNNRMELMAAIRGLETLTRNCQVVLVTDSKYVKDGITQWLPRWKLKNWRTASGSAVKNQDLWQALDAQCQRHQVEWQWTKGHAGHIENECVDGLARAGIPS